MLVDFDPPENPPPGLSPLNVAIIYEDFTSGARAKHFAESLAASLGCTCGLSESLWRTGLLTSPEIAAEAAQAAAASEYLIVSLAGTSELALETRSWLEAHLASAASSETCVIALLGSEPVKPRALEGNRRYLKDVCAAKSVPFFSVIAPPPAEGHGRIGWNPDAAPLPFWSPLSIPAPFRR
jgi:hypothetical protein